MSTPFDSTARTDAITNGITRLIVRGGLDGLTTRAIAQEAGISVGTLANHLSNRERVLRVCGARFSNRRLLDLRLRVERGTRDGSDVAGVGGLEPFLPGDRDEVALTRVWLGWRELARSDDVLARTIAGADLEERHLLLAAWVPGVPTDWRSHQLALIKSGYRDPLPDDTTSDLLHAAIGGIREAMCRAHGPMPLEAAQRALAAAASAFARSSPTIASGSAAE